MRYEGFEVSVENSETSVRHVSKGERYLYMTDYRIFNALYFVQTYIKGLTYLKAHATAVGV